ncbi:glycosyltransferase family 2 protein [Pseudarthrobacter sp. MEB009]|uniref:glycosyltransferase family 2 protein n=1 Tax=Pseudarthrobacter sp. MEB009 TaxID=3040326 RepID=UPI00255671A2|nr:glycosyltransferase family 2 protein [Pseudarthrobacter sp. MEB009]
MRTPDAPDAPEHLRLAVVIPAFRAQETIRTAIFSARESGAEEIIVVDDGSDDGTADMAERAGAVCIRQANSGAAQARSVGARAASAEYIVFLDADDELIPSGVKRSVELMDEDPTLAVAAGTVVGLTTTGEERPFPVRFSPVHTESLLVVGHGPWPPCAAVVRRAAYERSQNIEPQALKPRFAEDYEMLVRLSMVGAISVRDDPTCRYSLAGGKSVVSAIDAIESKENIRQHYASHLGLAIEIMTPREREMAALVRVARSHWSSGRRFSAARTVLAWIAKNPLTALTKLKGRPWKRN